MLPVHIKLFLQFQLLMRLRRLLGTVRSSSDESHYVSRYVKMPGLRRRCCCSIIIRDIDLFACFWIKNGDESPGMWQRIRGRAGGSSRLELLLVLYFPHPVQLSITVQRGTFYVPQQHRRLTEMFGYKSRDRRDTFSKSARH